MGGGCRRIVLPVGSGHRTPGRDHAVPEPEPLLYVLDIETDSSAGGLDPELARVLAVAVSGPDWEHVLWGDETGLLIALDQLLSELAPGVLCTWNGGRFDLPFLARRAALARLSLGLSLSACAQRFADDDAPVYRASWYRHRHLDVYRVYRADVGRALGVSCALKSIAGLVGLQAVEVDRERVHELDDDALAAYVASDARLAKQLAARRWASAQRAIDRAPAISGPDYAAAANAEVSSDTRSCSRTNQS